MLKHIPIPTVPTTSAIGTSVLTTFANSRPSRPTPITSIHNRSQQPLNVSTLTTASNGGPSLLQTFPNSHQSPLLTHTYPPDLHKPIQNGHVRMFTPLPTFSSNSQQQLLKSCGGNNSNLNNISSSSLSSKSLHPKECNGTREALTSLGLLCLGWFCSFFFNCSFFNVKKNSFPSFSSIVLNIFTKNNSWYKATTAFISNIDR